MQRETEDQGRGPELGHSQITTLGGFQPERRDRIEGEIQRQISAAC